MLDITVGLQLTGLQAEQSQWTHSVYLCLFKQSKWLVQLKHPPNQLLTAASAEDLCGTLHHLKTLYRYVITEIQCTSAVSLLYLLCDNLLESSLADNIWHMGVPVKATCSGLPSYALSDLCVSVFPQEHP